jgi:peptidoglycan hydrolase-like protein with peptidoglycan-binding domain
MRLTTTLAALMLSAALPAFAEPVALLIGNEDYARSSDVRRGDEIADARTALERADVRVVWGKDVDLEELQGALSEFGQMAGPSDTMLIALGGRFVHSQTETYFLPTDADTGPLATLAANALPLSTVTAWLADKPGKAVLVLASDDAANDLDPFLTNGVGDIDLPQGVTLLRAEPRIASRFIQNWLAKPGSAFVPNAVRNSVTISGYAPDDLVFLPVSEPEVAAPVPAQPATDDLRRIRDIRAWRLADSANTANGYRDYLEQFPDGQFVRMAENRLATMTETPGARAERAEQALDLTRDQRREIQRDLSLLDFNTRGIDGIFGRGTRTAISAWQKAQGFEETGFLTRDQITRLDAQAERRATELEAEAERRRVEQLAADRAFWDETGAFDDEAGLRAYLGRYPDGEYSEIAQERLAEIERQKRRDTDARDRQLWDEATQVNTERAYRDYLELAPRGAFRDEAETRVARIRAEESNAQANSAAARAEQAMNLSPRTRQVIEDRLDKLGLRPGPVDGTFDNDTRRAIRRYQASRNLEESGYLNEAVVVQLLADSVRQIFR